MRTFITDESLPITQEALPKLMIWTSPNEKVEIIVLVLRELQEDPTQVEVISLRQSKPYLKDHEFRKTSKCFKSALKNFTGSITLSND